MQLTDEVFAQAAFKNVLLCASKLKSTGDEVWRAPLDNAIVHLLSHGRKDLASVLVERGVITRAYLKEFGDVPTEAGEEPDYLASIKRRG